MTNEQWNERNHIIDSMAYAIANHANPYAPKEAKDALWESLSEEDKQLYWRYAYEAFAWLGGYGFQTAMVLAFEEYKSEK
jgi:hypothetical protein